MYRSLQLKKIFLLSLIHQLNTRVPQTYEGPGEPLAIASSNAATLVDSDVGSVLSSEISHPHFVDTREVPWFTMPTMPDVGLKLLR